MSRTSVVEPFFFRKPASRIETINDLDGDVINLFNCIRSDADHLCRLIATTPYSRQEYDTAFLATGDDPFEKARIFLIKCWQGHGFRLNCKSGWKNDIAGREYAYAARYWNNLPEWVSQITVRLKSVQIECRPAVDVIKRFNKRNVLIYADPPYLLSTRKMKKQYACEMTDSDHIELLETLLDHKGSVLLSGYDNELYNHFLDGWDKYQIDTTAEKGVHRTETLWVKKE